MNHENRVNFSRAGCGLEFFAQSEPGLTLHARYLVTRPEPAESPAEQMKS